MGILSPTRDLNYVEDTVNGIIEIYKSDKLFGEVTNIGSNVEISIGDLANKIFQLLNKNIEIVHEEERIRPENSEVERLLCDHKKIIKNTKWLPKYSLEQGLKETIEWISKNLSIYKSEIYNV